MALVWQNLTFHDGDTIWKTLLQYCFCKIPVQRARDPILNGVTGSVLQKELIALMGPSGAGKSTLFNCLANGKHYGCVNGKILVTSSLVPVSASFLTQNAEDHLLMNLTVSESLLYASKLKNLHFEKGNRHENVVKDLLIKLGLKEVEDRFIGLCSGGQKKRLAIGMELTGEPKPQFLFLDEPLSGLDSFSGLEVLKLLSKFALEYSMATVVTIHQPSFELFAIFNKAYIISKLGNCIYNGLPTNLMHFLKQSGYTLGNNDNPADIIIKIGSSVERDKEIVRDIENRASEMTRLEQICGVMTVSVKHQVQPAVGNMNDLSESGICTNHANFSFGALYTLFKRSFYITLWRSKKLIMIRTALHLVVAGVLAALYNREIGFDAGCFIPRGGFDPKNCSCIPTEDEIRKEVNTAQNVKFQFFSLLFLMFAALMPTVLTFPAEIKLFLNEHRNGWYTTGSYYISKTIIELPIQFCLSSLYTMFLYWYSNQIGMELDDWFMGWRFLHFLGVTWMSCYIAQGLGFLIGILCVNSFSISVILSSTVLLFLFLFSGFFVKVIQMNPYVKWITNLSFIRFSFESLLITLYGFERCESIPPLTQEPITLFMFGLEDSDYVINWAWLVGHLLISRILAYISLRSTADPTFLTIKESQACVKGLTKRLNPCCKRLGSCIFTLLKIIMAIFLIQLILALIIGSVTEWRSPI